MSKRRTTSLELELEFMLAIFLRACMRDDQSYDKSEDRAVKRRRVAEYSNLGILGRGGIDMIEEEIFARVREDHMFLRKLDLLRFLNPPKADRWCRERWEDEKKEIEKDHEPRLWELRRWSSKALYPREFLQLQYKESQEDIDDSRSTRA